MGFWRTFYWEPPLSLKLLWAPTCLSAGQHTSKQLWAPACQSVGQDPPPPTKPLWALTCLSAGQHPPKPLWAPANLSAGQHPQNRSEHQLAYQQVNTPQNRSEPQLAYQQVSSPPPPPPHTHTNLHSRTQRMANICVQKRLLKNTKNGQYLCQKNGRPNFSIEPGLGQSLAGRALI